MKRVLLPPAAPLGRASCATAPAEPLAPAPATVSVYKRDHCTARPTGDSGRRDACGAIRPS